MLDGGNTSPRCMGDTINDVTVSSNKISTFPSGSDDLGHGILIKLRVCWRAAGSDVTASSHDLNEVNTCLGLSLYDF